MSVENTKPTLGYNKKNDQVETITLNMVDVLSMLNLIEYNGLKDKMNPVAWKNINEEVDRIIRAYPQP